METAERSGKKTRTTSVELPIDNNPDGKDVLSQLLLKINELTVTTEVIKDKL